MFDLRHEAFFRPLWRRIAVVVICLGWATLEFVAGALFWGALFAGIGVYAIWQLFLVFDPAAEREGSGKDRE